MSSYRRPKKEDIQKPTGKVLSVEIGSVKNDLESLKVMCDDKANEIAKTEDLESGEAIQVVFWSGDIAEIIGTANIIKNEAGIVSYSMDYSLSTL